MSQIQTKNPVNKIEVDTKSPILNNNKVKLKSNFDHQNHIAAAIPNAIHSKNPKPNPNPKIEGETENENKIKNQEQNHHEKQQEKERRTRNVMNDIISSLKDKDRKMSLNSQSPSTSHSSRSGVGAGDDDDGIVSSNSKSATDTETDSNEGSLDFGIGTRPGDGPLLGSEELDKYLTGRKARVQVTTWNMGSLPPPKEYQLRKLFYHEQDDSLKKVDIHVISIQECWPDADAWEMELQICLGPAFALFHSISFGTLHISIFLRRDLLWFTTEPSDYTLSVRSGRLFKTKGSAGIQFGFFGSRLLFISAHLSAGHEPEREKQRVEELKKIVESYGSKFSGSGLDSPDVIFLCGDLNFRISGMTREQVIYGLKYNQISKILERDELHLLFNRKRDSLPKCMVGFQEAASITFRPTYKYDIGTDEFDTSNKKRCPAYTDRIIYKCPTKSKVTINSNNTQPKSKSKANLLHHPRNHSNKNPQKHQHPVNVRMTMTESQSQNQNHCQRQSSPSSSSPLTTTEVVCLAYESVTGIRLSDHKPVYSIFTVQIKPGFDTLPLSGAKFKKDLFTKAAQKRAKFLLERRKKLASTLCNVS